MKVVVAILICCAPFFSVAQSRPDPATVKPFVLGQVRELASAILGEKRTLNIYLPEGYNVDDYDPLPGDFTCWMDRQTKTSYI